ncbi:MAG: hypothetical protein AAF570_08025 [Bacteroidota bacterium]
MVAFFQKPRDIKQDEGFLTPGQIAKHSVFFSKDRRNEFPSGTPRGNDGRLTRVMWAIMQKYGRDFSLKVEDIEVGDIVFSGDGTARNIETVSHVVICTEIVEVNGETRYYFAHSGVAEYIHRSVSQGRVKGPNHYISPDGSIWNGLQYFKGVGKLP